MPFPLLSRTFFYLTSPAKSMPTKAAPGFILSFGRSPGTGEDTDLARNCLHLQHLRRTFFTSALSRGTQYCSLTSASASGDDRTTGFFGHFWGLGAILGLSTIILKRRLTLPGSRCQLDYPTWVRNATAFQGARVSLPHDLAQTVCSLATYPMQYYQVIHPNVDRGI